MKSEQEQIYDSSEQTNHRTAERQPLKTECPPLTQPTIEQFIELIRKTFKDIPPQLIVQRAYNALGLHTHQPTHPTNARNNNFSSPPQRKPASPAFNDLRYSSDGRRDLSLKPGHESDRRDMPRKRGRPRKTYQDERRDEVHRQEMISQLSHPNRVLEQSKDDKERQFAQIMIEYGYGVTIVKKRVLFSFDPNFYYNCMKNVIYRSFRKLEEKVRTQCKEPIEPSEDYKTLKFKTELCSFEKWLPKDESLTFKEYIKSVYDLNPKPVSKGKTVRLYRNILARWAKMKNLDSRFKETKAPTDPSNSHLSNQ